MKAYTVKGTTDEVTECELCGRVELKGTVVLVPLDAEGNEDGELVYFGTSCAAKAAGWTVTETNRRVKDAERAERERQFAEREEAREAQRRVYRAWLLENYGSDDQSAICRERGYRTARPLLEAYDAYRMATA